MAAFTLKLGSKVRHRGDDGWSAPGCVVGTAGDKFRVYWPDENVFSDERPGDLSLYGMESATQPDEIAA